MVLAATESTPDYQAETAAPDDAQKLLRELKTIVARLEKEAEDRVSKRGLVEDRWLIDLGQYHGKYDAKTLKELKDAGKSQLFINQTRPKTGACEARLSDMLFPTDDRNWGIGPTPIPELTVDAEESAMRAAKAKQAAATNPEDPALQQAAAEAEQAITRIQAHMEEARKRARAMEEEIDDHLRQCQYSIQSRAVIHDACVLGTGIMKGPVTGDKYRRSWMQRDVTDESGAVAGKEYVLGSTTDKRPSFWRVDPWNFFPDFDARSMDDNEGTFERHLMNAKELRKLARQKGFDANAIRRVLRDLPHSTIPTYISELRSITGAYNDASTNRYHVWEYHGTLTAEEMRSISAATGREDVAEDLELNREDVDPLAELNVILWFCQGELLKFSIHPLDSCDSVYSVFCLEKDEASIFGFGVPYMMRDSQKALCAAWRTMMDNAGLASGPQIEANPEVVEPANGVWGLEPRKLWLRKPGAPANAVAFNAFDIPMHQAEMANIIEMAKRNIDEETSIPVLAQGEQGSHVTQTAHGMNILMNSVNVVFRRIVKNWDDDMTTPNIRRVYDFLMQFSPKEYIKGDFEVDARGTSVLLVREMQSANLMTFLMNFGAHPILGKYLKEEGVPALRRLVQTMMIPAEDLVKTDEEIAADAAKAAEQPPMPDPEILKLEAQMNLAQMKREEAIELAYINRDTVMMQTAAQMNMTVEQLATDLEKARISTASKERIFAAEAAIEARNAARGMTQGSGGYISAGPPNG